MNRLKNRKNHVLGGAKRNGKNKVISNFAMALRARPAQRPCSAPWQNLRGPLVVPVVDIVGWVVSGECRKAGAADSVFDVFRPRDSDE